MSTLTKSKIPTCDYTWNPVRGCNNKSCFLHPSNQGGCWAAKQCKIHAKPFAKSERYYLSELFESELPRNINYLNQRVTANIEETFSEKHTGRSKCLSQKELEYNLKNFIPTWFKSQFDKKFPKKQSRIFIFSQTDFAYIPPLWVECVLEKIRQNNEERKSAGLLLHDFLFLTKEPSAYGKFELPANCQLGFTATDQVSLNRCIDIIVNIEKLWTTMPRLIYAYLEPLQEQINLSIATNPTPIIDWVIVGGQRGPGVKPINPDWVRLIRDHCQAAMIPFYFKGFGAGKKDDTIDGRTWHEFPEVK